MCIVGLRSAERIVLHHRAWRTIVSVNWSAAKILQPASATGISDEDIQLSVRSECDRTSVVIPTAGGRRRLPIEGRLQRAKHDDVRPLDKCCSVPGKPVDAIA